VTEIPEHLLARAAKRRKEMTGEGGDDATSTETAPATTAESTPAAGASAPALVTPSPVVDPPPEPVKPWVQAATTRQKIPVWVAPVLVFLPVWFAIYWATLEPPTREVTGPLALGEETYTGAQCAGCHGAAGGGGVGPQLSAGEVLLTFPDWESQVAWIVNGSSGGDTPYGSADRPGGQRLSRGGMPGYAASLDSEALLAVVLYERVQHGLQPIGDLADLEGLIEALDAGDVALEFAGGETPDDIVSMVAALGLDSGSLAAE
jgi:mono/diheme cytochrome c family protein